MLAVIVVVVGAVVVGVTPVGEVIKAKICEALEAGCSSRAMEERVNDLAECVTRQDTARRPGRRARAGRVAVSGG